MRIMIVDDNDAMHELVRESLSASELEYSDCSDGESAVELYKVLQPDWVVMDVMMEKMDGLRATEAILAADPAAKIIVITQHEESTLRDKAKRIGAKEFVHKADLDRLPEIILRG